MSAFVMGIGIGAYNVHLVARAIYGVTSDEHRSTVPDVTPIGRGNSKISACGEIAAICATPS